MPETKILACFIFICPSARTMRDAKGPDQLRRHPSFPCLIRCLADGQAHVLDHLFVFSEESLCTRNFDSGTCDM